MLAALLGGGIACEYCHLAAMSYQITEVDKVRAAACVLVCVVGGRRVSRPVVQPRGLPVCLHTPAATRRRGGSPQPDRASHPIPPHRRSSWGLPRSYPMVPCCRVWAPPQWPSWPQRSACRVRGGTGVAGPALPALACTAAARSCCRSACLAFAMHPAARPHRPTETPLLCVCVPAVLVCCETYKFHKRVQLDSITHNEVMEPGPLAQVRVVGGEGGAGCRELRRGCRVWGRCAMSPLCMRGPFAAAPATH